MPIIEYAIFKHRYRYLWLKYVHGVNLKEHCIRCLRGPREPQVRNGVARLDNITLHEAPAYYLCGVEEHFTWAKNLHIAFREKEGSVIDLDNDFVKCRIIDAEEIPISTQYIDWSLPQADDPRFNTCRNWQFANMCAALTLDNKSEMKIYTSYFANYKELAKQGIKIINTARFPPRWLSAPSLNCVKPSPMLIHIMDPKEYTARYQAEVLADLDYKSVMDEIHSLAEGGDVALCCYEKPGELCHRHILATWLNEHGEDIHEYQKEEEPNLFNQPQCS